MEWVRLWYITRGYQVGIPTLSPRCPAVSTVLGIETRSAQRETHTHTLGFCSALHSLRARVEGESVSVCIGCVCGVCIRTCVCVIFCPRAVQTDG